MCCATIFLTPNLGPCPIADNYYLWAALQFSMLGPSIHSLDAKLWQCSILRMDLKPSIMWLCRSVVVRDSSSWEMRPPLWDCEIRAEIVSLMSLMVAPWELRGLRLQHIKKKWKRGAGQIKELLQNYVKFYNCTGIFFPLQKPVDSALEKLKGLKEVDGMSI